MSLRVIQWATGSVGVAAIKGVLQHPELELVGCWVHSAAKSGKDVGEIIGSPPLGVIATNSIDDVLALDADAVIYAPLLPSVDEVAALLRSGKNVVTPLGWFYPSEKEAAPLEVAAQAGNATLHGAGIGPGAVTELFPLLLSVMSTGVTFVRSEEFSDLRSYGAPDVLRYVMGFGGTPDSALTGPMQKILDGGFLQSVRLCVDRLGFAADPQIRTSQEVAVATAPIDSPIGVIEPGQVAGRRFHWEALVEDTVVVQIAVNWLMGSENLDPPWSFGPAGERYEIEVRGSPDTCVTIKGWQPQTVAAGLKSNPGIVATAAPRRGSRAFSTCRSSPAGPLPGWHARVAGGVPGRDVENRTGNPMAKSVVVEQSRAIPVQSEDAFGGTLAAALPVICSHWYGLIPPIKEVRDQTGAWDSVGQARVITMVGGGRVREELTSVDPPRSFGYTLTDIKGPLAPLVALVEGKWSFAPADTGTTVTWQWTIHPRSALAAPVLPVFARMWRGYARGVLEKLSALLVG